ncbi:MAG: PEP-CTERM sorting domain-containing protein [Planctomycetia bacterium]|nr:PEP-CTERM sorting domain-containing protein [Planctomycetia bacterium]
MMKRWILGWMVCLLTNSFLTAAEYSWTGNTTLTGSEGYTADDTITQTTNGIYLYYNGNTSYTIPSTISAQYIRPSVSQSELIFSGKFSATTMNIQAADGKVVLTGTASFSGSEAFCNYGWLVLGTTPTMLTDATMNIHGGVISSMAGKNMSLNNGNMDIGLWAGVNNAALIAETGSTLTIGSQIHATRGGTPEGKLYIGQAENAGTVILSNSTNSYFGGTYIGYPVVGRGLKVDENQAVATSTARLQMGASNVLGTGVVDFYSGTNAPTSSTAFTLDMNGYSDTVAGLRGFGQVQNSSGTTPSALTLDVPTGGAYDFSGTISGGTMGITLTKTGAGTQTFSGAGNTKLDLIADGGTTILASTTRDGIVNNLTINSGAVVQYAKTASTNQILETVTLNGGTLDLNGGSEIVTSLNPNSGTTHTQGTVHNGTLTVRGKNGYVSIGGSGKIVYESSDRMDFRVANTYTGGSVFNIDNEAIWLTDNLSGETATFDPLGTGQVQISANVQFNNLGYGGLITLNNDFLIDSGKTLTLNQTVNSASNGFLFTNTISGNGTLAKIGSTNATTQLLGAISPGTTTNPIGTLTLDGDFTLGDDWSMVVQLGLDDDGNLIHDQLIWAGGEVEAIPDGAIFFDFLDGLQPDDNMKWNVDFLTGLTGWSEGLYDSLLNPSQQGLFHLAYMEDGLYLLGNAQVPEPASWILLLGMLAGWGWLRKGRKRMA